MARAIWKGVIGFSGEELPVKLYSALEDRNIHFHLLSPRTGERVRQRMVHPQSGKEVAADQIQKGFELGAGRFVVLDASDLEEIQPEPSRAIRIDRFVDRTEIDHRWYDRPYYLGPDGEAAHEPYFALAQALESLGQEGVAHWVMRNKSYVGSLHSRDGYLMLLTMRRTGEVIDTRQLEAPSGEALSKREAAMAQQLVAAYEEEFDPDDFRDQHRARIRELIEAKAAGAPVKVRKLRQRRPSKDLAGALEASLAKARKGGKKTKVRSGASRG